MIKQIQLRGISRKPSDRMTSDGGCSESINVQIEAGEVAPIINPEDITTEYNSVGDIAGPILFIHKGVGYENLITLDDLSGWIVGYPRRDGNTESQPIGLFEIEDGEEILDVTSVGNTVVVGTDRRLEYVLYKNGVYTDMGNSIPVPDIEFKTIRYKVNGAHPSVILLDNQTKELLDSFTPRVPYSEISAPVGSGQRRADDEYDSDHHSAYYPPSTAYDYVHKTSYDGIKGWSSGTWRSYLNGESMAIEDYSDSYGELNTTLWDMLKAQMHILKGRGYFCTPVFARYAVRLYDGSYIHQSVPVLLGAGDAEFFKAYGKVVYDGSDSKSYLVAYIQNAYKVKAYLKEYAYEGWEDIVKSIDIFLSTDIHTPRLNGNITGFCENLTMVSTNPAEPTTKFYDLYFDDSDEDVALGQIKDEVLSKSIFYKIASFGAGNTEDIVSGYDLLTRREITSQDYLVSQERLPDGYQDFHVKSADNMYMYNNRLILSGIRQSIYPGYPYMNGAVARLGDGAVTDESTYKLKFYLRDDSTRSLKVITRNDEGGTDIHAYSVTEVIIQDTYSGYAEAYAWIAYPDSRCYKVDVSVTKAGVTVVESYDMEPHPYLACSFAFLGLSTKVGGVEYNEPNSPISWDDSEQRVSEEPNMIWASAMDNPFVFPVEGKMSFLSKVIGMAVATDALSEGQFGQFPMYVFTRDGVWALTVTSTGDFASKSLVSRDVALSKKSIQPIDKAVAFVTARGVMILQGASLVNISQNMNGPHYTLPEDIRSLLMDDMSYTGVATIASADITFNKFMENCAIGYDYVHDRLLFLRQRETYMFVYKLDSQTWHKMTLPSEIATGAFLNSFPRCYAASRDHTPWGVASSKVFDLSVEYDASADQHASTGLIVTRPFDLGEPDVRKTIRSIRVRGMFHRNHVRYILQGSFDGHSWKRLRSLRGGSYKMFRLILLLDINPAERVSWIEVDYETRFTNRLR